MGDGGGGVLHNKQVIVFSARRFCLVQICNHNRAETEAPN